MPARSSRKGQAPRPPRARGRPPATVSADTRERILGAARRCFSRFGYSKTTNKHIADEAGITTGAIYHYFSSKQELFGASAGEVQRVVLDQFEDAIAGIDSFTERIQALLERSIQLHADDPWLARFVSVEPVELTRHPELRALVGEGQRGVFRFLHRLAVEASDRGELAEGADPMAVANMLVAATMGLALFAAVVDSKERHRAATQAFEELINGTLIATSANGARRTRLGRRSRTVQVGAQ
jgi:AcrR family transcriptional regulator